jgi:hypothetical protein
LSEAATLRHTTTYFSCCDLHAEVHGLRSRIAQKVNNTAYFFDCEIPRFLPASN